MKIALNAILFLPGRIGGLEIYFRNLLTSLQRQDRDNRYALLCDRHYAGEFTPLRENFRIQHCNYSKPSPGWFFRGVIRNLCNIDILKPVMERVEADLIHHPFSILSPLHGRIPTVLTFHDMQHEFFPEYFSAYEMRVRKEFYRASAERATRIMAISRYSRDCLVDRYGVSPEKIDVVYLGYNAASYRILDDTAELDRIRSKYRLDRPFLYYPAATWPHKNHDLLLRALKLLQERHGFDGQLVLTGIAMGAHDAILSRIAQLGLQDRVRVLGYLPYEDLPCLYNLARALVFPSRFEGFGIPLVEAMACGCPVACSNVTSIPEIVGPAGIFFDPDAVEDMAAQLWRLWSDEPLRRKLSNEGLVRVKQFGWDVCARETLESYRKAVA